MKSKSLFKLKPIAAAFITATALTIAMPFTSQRAEALMPVTDVANFVQATWANLMRSIESGEALAVAKQTMDAIGNYTEMEVDNVNNGFANMIARLGKGEEERQNLEQLEKAQPAQDACTTIVASTNLNDASCAVEETLDQFVKKNAEKQSMATGGGTFHCVNEKCEFKPGVPPNSDDMNKKNAVDAKVAINACDQLMDGNISLCEKPELLMFGTALTDKEYKAVDLQIEIAGNIQKPLPYADDSLDKESIEFKRARAQDLRRENMRGFAVLALKNLHLIQNGSIDSNNKRKRGEIEVLNDFMNDRIRSEKWLCEVTQSCDGEYVGPSEIDRRGLQLDAVSSYIALQHYKSSLRIEKYLTDIALMEIDSVNK